MCSWVFILFWGVSLTASESAINITDLTGKWGLYYEQIGELLISNIHWKLFIRTDLADLQIQKNNINQLFNEMKRLCQRSRDEFHEDECSKILLHVGQAVQNINFHDKTLRELLGLPNHARAKRGLFNAIGTISKQLFGTLDENDAQSYHETLSKLQADQTKTKYVLSSHTSILEKIISEFNNSNQYAVDIQARLNDIEYLSTDRNNQIAAELRRARSSTLLVESFDIFLLLTSQYKFAQSHLFDILEAARHGHLHPYVISPDELQQELGEIQKQFDSHMQWPVPIVIENINNLLRTIDVKIYVTDNKIVYLLNIPVLSQKPFTMYQVTSLPKRVKDNIFSLVVPSAELLIMGKDHHYFIQLNKIQLKECINLNQITYLCSKLNALEISYSKQSCDFELFHPIESIPAICAPRSMALNSTMFLQLAASNSWMFVAPVPERVQLTCNTGVQHEEIRGVGILKLRMGCELHTKQVVLTTEKFFESSFNFSRTSELIHFDLPFFNDTDLLKLPLRSTQAHVLKTQNQIHRLKELSSDIEELKDVQNILFSQRQTKIFHWSYGSVLLVIVIIILGYLIYRRYALAKMKPPSPFQSNPPKPRRRTINLESNTP